MFSSKDIFFGSQASGYRVSNSLRFRNSASAYLTRTPSSAGNRTTWTWSGWVKRGLLSGSTGYGLFQGKLTSTDLTAITFSNDIINIQDFSSAGGYNLLWSTSAVFRDPSSWYHVVVAYDTTQASSANAVKLYVNGVQQTLTFTASTGSYLQNRNSFVNATNPQEIGNYYISSYFDGYMAEVNFIGGSALAATSFGSYDTNGIWQPISYAGSYSGTNSFYLPFSDNSSPTNVLTGNVGLGKDFSGNGNYWTTNNISLAGSTVTSFTSVGSTSWTAPAGVTSVRYLVVAGGGGGGYSIGGGGGGGGVLTGSLTVIPGNSYTITVGGGGAGATASPGWGTNGGNSSISGTGITTVTATGGGGGGGNSTSQPGQVGGSGGGAGEGAFYGAGTTGQGFRGGSAYDAGANFGSGGGGGAGAIGSDGTSAGGGAGGTGIASSITGSSVFYGGGGGGGMYPAGSAGPGGSGGGGTAGSSGTANTGGGGGGATLGGSNSGAGGSGIVILSYGSGVTYDSMIDSPTNYADGGNGRGNYAVLSPLDINASNTQRPTDGNLTYPVSSAVQYSARGTIFVSSGKWYAEFTISSSSAIVAVVNSSALLYGYTATNGIFTSTTSIYNNGTQVQSGLAAFAANDVIGVAFDADANSVQFYKNGSTYGTAVTISAFSGPFTFQTGANGAVCTIYANFGQRGFVYTPPSGYSALNTQNLSTPTITNGAQYMAAVTYTGNSSTQTITTSSTNSGNNPNGTSFQPDFVWIKNRSIIAQHVLTDVVRGVDKQLFSSLTNAEQTSATGITSFNSNGFSLGSNVSPTGDTNSSPNSFIAWQWKAGNSSGATNTSGSITSTVSVNTSAGFSVVTFTAPSSGAYTFGHGLGVAPQLVISKERNAVGIWSVYHASAGSARLQLESTAAGTASVWTTLPTSTTVWFPSSYADSNQRVAYCFAPVAGYSGFGSYTGNGSADGPFVYLGFRPRWVLIKSTVAAEGWNIFDTSRDTYNPELNLLFPNASSAEFNNGSTWADVTSNGFKIRYNTSPFNTSGGTYIYAAFAENPFKISRAR